MGLYQKKPITVEAHQWFRNGDHPEDRVGEQAPDLGFPGVTYTRLEGAVVRYYRRPGIPGEALCKCGHTFHDHGWIDTPEGGYTVCPGDWIITGIKGERYPCKPDVFEDTYRQVS